MKTESFPPAGGSQLIVWQNIHCRLPSGKMWQVSFVLSDRMVLFYSMGAARPTNSPRCGLLGNDLQDHIWYSPCRAFQAVLFHQLVDPVRRCLFNLVHLFVCSTCVSPLLPPTIPRKFWHFTFAYWVAAAKRTGRAKSRGAFCMWC